MWRGLIGVIAVATAGTAAADQTISFSDLFSQTGQSLWSAGPGISIDTGTKRLGPDPWDLGDTVGKIVNPCDPFNCSTGVQVGAHTSGNFGLEYGVKLDSGTFDTLYPLNVKLNVKTDPGSGFTRTIATSFTTPGYTAPALANVAVPQLETHTPTLQAFVDLKASFSAFAGAQACVAGICQGPAITPYGPLAVDKSQTLVALNRNNDGKFVIGGQTYSLGQNHTTLDGDLTARLNLPNLDATASGGTATQLQTNARDNIVALSANVGNIVSKALGLPLVGDYGPIGYDLLNVNAGLALDVKQTLSITYTPMEHFHFTSPVSEIGGPSNVSDLIVPLGSAFSVTSPKFSVGVIPDTFLEAQVTNQTDLVLSGDFSLQAGGFNVFGQQIGPLYNSGDLQAASLDIPVYTNIWSTNLGDFSSAGFNLLAGSTLPGSLPPYLRGEFVSPENNDGPYSGANANYLTNLATTACSLAALEANTCGDYSFVNEISPRILNLDGSPIYKNPGDPLSLAPNETPPFESNDGNEQRLLSNTGYSPTGLGGFTIPAGAAAPPGSAVPEPNVWLLLIAGFGLVGTTQRRRLRHGRSPSTVTARRGSSPRSDA
jgi:hypothetical protein